jgi:uncharacterized protein (TIGR03000 family)
MFLKTFLFCGALALATVLLSSNPGLAQGRFRSGLSTVSRDIAPAPPDGSAHVMVRVPPNAEVWFDGAKMPQAGPVRLFRTPPLTPGRLYYYEVRARWITDGREDSQTRTVFVSAGDVVELDFPTAVALVGQPIRGTVEGVAKAR